MIRQNVALALLLPRFDEGEVERERQRGIAEIQQSQDDPEHVADRAYQYHVFGAGAHPYAHPPEGTIASMKALAREDLVRFHADAMVPDGAVRGKPHAGKQSPRRSAAVDSPEDVCPGPGRPTT